MKKCLTTNELVGYVDGILARMEIHRINAHLRTCPNCQKKIDELMEDTRLDREIEEERKQEKTI